ncbi:hypothetical protein F2P81_023894 [Scophthalmus maximus]|uniref:Uncharacterized protein n=1 Tax=Scophthalmus maximus TaxID=52904 RepID=A0A6A4RXS9_SCOMX|nr:hypothetical protein F2P81_023894 [Scophthalmus maximus]
MQRPLVERNRSKTHHPAAFRLTSAEMAAAREKVPQCSRTLEVAHLHGEQPPSTAASARDRERCVVRHETTARQLLPCTLILALTKPMSLAYCLKHWRHMLSPYLRISPCLFEQTRLEEGEKTSVSSDLHDEG